MKQIMILLPIVLLGALAGLAFSGVINVPGISPEKKKARAFAQYAEPKDENGAGERMPLKKPPTVSVAAKRQRREPEEEIVAAATEVKPEIGAKKLGSLWNEVEAASLGLIVKDWRDDDLAKVLVKMDPTKVAELLATLKPARASKLSAALKKEASVVPVRPPG